MLAQASVVMAAGSHRVAILPWGDVIEDFLGPIGWSIEDFATSMSGGWLFGYVEALAHAGVESVIVVFSRAPDARKYTLHQPTGTALHCIPWSVGYRALRRVVRAPYDALPLDGAATAARGAHRLLSDVLPYLATPRRALERGLVGHGCDAVLVQEYEDPRFDLASLVAERLAIPVFATFQGGCAPRSRLEFRKRHASIHRAAGLIVPSRREAMRVREAYGVEPDRIAIITNPIDEAIWFPERLPETRNALGIAPDARVVAWHGRVDISVKGLDVLLAAWSILCVREPYRDVRLLLIGNGADADLFRSRYGQTPGMIWIDQYLADRTRMRQLLSSADVYVCPSRREGAPVAPAEAMACGLPVVASRIAGTEDLLDGGDASGGMLFPSADAPELAAALGALLTDVGRRRTMGVAARQRALVYCGRPAVGQALRQLMYAGRGAQTAAELFRG